MPRFCSSNTRPNSLLIGCGISVATMLNPKARLWPARSVRASISRASGNCAANAFRRRLRRKAAKQAAASPSATPTNGINAGVDANQRRPAATPTTAMTSEMASKLRDASGSCRPAGTADRMLPNRSRNVSTMPGLSSSGWDRMLASLAAAVLAAGAGDAGQQVEAVFDLAGRLVAQEHERRAADHGGDSDKRQDCQAARNSTLNPPT